MRNHSDKTLLVYPDQSTVLVEGPDGAHRVDLLWSPINLTGLDRVGGPIRAGVVKVGGFWYPLPEGVTMADVQAITLRIDGPTDARFAPVGPEYVFVVDLSDRPHDPYTDAVIAP